MRQHISYRHIKPVRNMFRTPLRYQGKTERHVKGAEQNKYVKGRVELKGSWGCSGRVERWEEIRRKRRKKAGA